MKQRSGMSLLEAMIALTLFGFIWMGGQHALSLVQATAMAQGDRGDSFMVARQLQNWISETKPVRTRRRTNAPLLFQGEAHRIAFVTDLPHRFGQAGPHLVSLQSSEEGLVLEWSPLRVEAVERQKHLLMPGAREIELRYRAADGQWQEVWSDLLRLPAFVELKVGSEPAQIITAHLRAGA